MTPILIIGALLVIGYTLFAFALWRCRINERRERAAMRMRAAIWGSEEDDK